MLDVQIYVTIFMESIVGYFRISSHCGNTWIQHRNRMSIQTIHPIEIRHRSVLNLEYHLGVVDIGPVVVAH